jgi:SLT domain-containing protein
MEKLATARDKIAAKIAAANELSTSVTSGAKDFASIAGLTLGSTKTLSREFRSKLASISNFAKNIATLKKKGFSSELIAQLLAEGIDQAAPMAEQLIKASPSQVHSFNGTQRAIDRTAKKLGVVAVNAQFGKSAATNFVASLRSQEASLERQMRSLAKVFARGVGHAFHIKGYARGGRFAANQMAVVGEQGPEVVKFGSAGTVYPNVGPWPMVAPASRRESAASYEGPSAEAIGEAVARYISGSTLKVDGRGVARLVNNQNLRTGPGSRVGRRTP